ncbi:tyrosine-protein phosphatase [Patulibacter defluvii]|uniref:tyrosine-protein phosphatase n=1 Tax=Patulibacter defluvii TaxID=3095358 RepID=UPI002A764D22|nr:tyrosine-protein phosphatase [Patulibacter sp. DM4]
MVDQRHEAIAGWRLMAAPGTANFRDFGGYATARGTVARGRLFRADGLADLGPDGRDALAALGLRTVVDLREPVEREQHPDDLGDLAVRWQGVAVLGELGTAAVTDLGELYVELLDGRGWALTEAVRALAAPDALPAVVHCSAGKDRTGLVAALTLALLGVDEQEIVADYALTGVLLRGRRLAEIRRRAVEAGLDEQTIAVALDAPPAAMRRALDHVRRAHGGAEAYLRAHGATARELDALRAATLERD